MICLEGDDEAETVGGLASPCNTTLVPYLIYRRRRIPEEYREDGCSYTMVVL